MTVVDPLTGRIVADDAAAALCAFRSSGNRPFHELGLHGARTFYEATCAANGLTKDVVTRVEDYIVDGTFRVRIYDPRPPTEYRPSPVIVFFHGGGWVMGGLETHDTICRRLATRTCLPVASVDYRLAPEHPYPAAINDCRAALRWLEGSTDHQLTPRSIIMVGDSAGGQLAASLTLEASQRAACLPVVAQVLLYPVTDLVDTTVSYQRITTGFALTADTMRWFISLYLPPGTDRSTSDLSPLRAHLPPTLPPTFICTVDNDPLAEEGIQYSGALACAGTEVLSVHLTGYAHGLFTSAGAIARGEQMVDTVTTFITEHTSHS